ncbi:hypothetical protein Tco_1166867 [Tanacetum coccineum]
MPSTPGGIEPSFQEIPRSLPFKITSSEGSERWRARIDHKVRRRSGIATFRNFKYFLNIFFTSNVNNIDSVPDSIYCILEAFYPESYHPQRSSMNLDHSNLGNYRMYRVDAILKTHDAGIP